MQTLYQLKKRDLSLAADILLQAFMNDPLKQVFAGGANYEQKYRAFFTVPMTFALKYGKVYAPSENLQGIMAVIPGKLADMSFGRMLRSGAIRPALKMGADTYKKIMPFVNHLSQERKQIMGQQDFYYLAVIGVDPQFQERGHGKKLLTTLIEQSEQENLPVYLETETENNAAMYQHFGFKIMSKKMVEGTDLTIWTMLREPYKNDYHHLL
ncbi:Acetyltransferase (GNAT) family protein [Amphibacillus marinus]|uniref:Acetyltransferase (GNAT) family protein n=1 Tax=Amphibacillus marinus TaxID=872970 RepID=A0A1H8PLT8_9BACI|nr:GNAT family N-acetyltransferase [Amphibacillus marinus]SEO42875.1 Acetyltransferase (GNAT) family protein [Amphibacillus marinus]